MLNLESKIMRTEKDKSEIIINIINIINFLSIVLSILISFILFFLINLFIQKNK